MTKKCGLEVPYNAYKALSNLVFLCDNNFQLNVYQPIIRQCECLKETVTTEMDYHWPSFSLGENH